MASIPDTLVRAIDLQNQGRPDEAGALFNEVLRDDPGNAHALYSLSLIALTAQRLPDALALATSGVT